ncbi:UDP-glucose 4-epimerase [Paenibacillus anaericanus]|uniref:NAD-dependent epimerase/dehydratase family protein n=1 Tax=Paenibacillus anaericanus TaxID=170367 RepID=UPI00277EA735|nr:NAD-dependent epimerase/dehydratase family protein [Paenibacillus anaericanus]MDQ0090656.1 UDP-glucose 4-epimerase [Paenibacillus anaericanus]
MKILVTGGAGFIGSHIVDQLVKEGHKTIVIDNLSTGNKDNIPNQVKLYRTDILSLEAEQIFAQEKPDCVIHHAAQIDVSLSLQDPEQDARNNILGTLRLLALCQQHQVRKFIYASSCAVYGETKDCSITEDFAIHPISFYGLSKFTPEVYIRLYCDLYGLSYSIFRYANVYGPRQTSKGESGVISLFARKMIAGDIVHIFGDGQQTRDFVYVKDVANANILALTSGDNQIINIGTDTKTSMNALFQNISYLTHYTKAPEYSPKRAGDISFSRLDASKAKRLLGWQPSYSLQAGLKETIHYMGRFG